MTRREIELQLKLAVDAMTPDVLSRIDLTTPQEMPVPEAFEDLQKRRSWLPGSWLSGRRGGVLAAAACLCLMFGGLAWQEGRVVSVVGLDVNPSIELSLNWRDQVLKAQALNEDASEAVDASALRGRSVEDAVGEVIGSLADSGYLQEESSAILVTVSRVSRGNSGQLQETVGKSVETSLEEKQVTAVVYSQQLEPDSRTEQLAEEYDISLGKAGFLQNLADQNESLSEEQLGDMARLNMGQLSETIAENQYALGDRVTATAGGTGAPEEITGDEPETEAEPDLQETSEPVTEPSGEEPETAEETETEADQNGSGSETVQETNEDRPRPDEIAGDEPETEVPETATPANGQEIETATPANAEPETEPETAAGPAGKFLPGIDPDRYSGPGVEETLPWETTGAEETQEPEETGRIRQTTENEKSA